MSVVDPLVSVVVPSWQKGRFLRSTLESLLQQTYPHVEIIVQDNASTDETARILAEYAPRLTHSVSEPDAGQSDALRRGFARARGDILGWLNADDLLMPEAIAQAVTAFQHTPQPDVVYGHCALIDEAGQFLRYFHEIQPFSADVLLNRLNFIAQPSTFFSRAAYEQVGGIDGVWHYVMDWDLWSRFAQAECIFYFLDEVLSAARTYPETKTSGGGGTRLAEILKLNLRHKTTRWPLAAIAHAYHDFIASRQPWIHAVLRRLWQTLTGQHFMMPSIIHGIAFPDRVATMPARVHFPHYGNLATVSLYLDHVQNVLPLHVTLNGHAGKHQHNAVGTSVTWAFSPTQHFTDVDLEIRLDATRPMSEIRLREVILQK